MEIAERERLSEPCSTDWRAVASAGPNQLVGQDMYNGSRA